MTWICLKHALPASITCQGARDSWVIYALKGIEYTSSWLYRLITLLHCMTVTRNSSLIRFSKSFKYITLSCSASISPKKKNKKCLTNDSCKINSWILRYVGTYHIFCRYPDYYQPQMCVHYQIPNARWRTKKKKYPRDCNVHVYFTTLA